MFRVFLMCCVIASFSLGWHSTTVSGAVSWPVSEPDGVPPEPQAEMREDLYGNDVSPAVGEYRIDGLGELYEEHAPDTALLKLGPPST